MKLGQHITVEEIKAYVLRSVSEPELSVIQQHLRWCQECTDRVAAMERFIARVRAGIIRGGFEVEFLAEEFKPKGRS